MAAGDVFQGKLFSDALGQTMLNVFYWEQVDASGAAPPAQELAEAFETDVLPEMADTLSTSMTFNRLEMLNVAVPTEFYINPFGGGVPGTQAGDMLPLTVCWSLRYPRAFPGTRDGWKRLSGIAEADINGTTPSPAALIRILAAGEAMEADIAGLTTTWKPVIVGKPIILGFNPPVRYDVSQVEFGGVGTQNSRKVPFITS